MHSFFWRKALKAPFWGKKFIQSLDMLRREIRERRELLFRKKKEQAQNSLQERREYIKNAIDKGNPLPHDMRKGAKKLAEGSTWGEQIDGVDDEYRWAGCQDPKVVITTSRDPSASLKRFVKVGQIYSLFIPLFRKLNWPFQIRKPSTVVLTMSRALFKHANQLMWIIQM